MKNLQSISRSKLLACLFAFLLAFGLSAIPLVAAQGAEETGGEVSTQSAEPANADAATDVPASEPKAEKPAPAPQSSASETPGKSSEPAASDKGDSASKDDAASDELNPVEKFGAVMKGESKAALHNATGISAQADDPYSEEDQTIEDQIANSIVTQYSYDDPYAPNPDPKTGELTITKNLSGFIFTMSDADATYTVIYDVVGVQLDDEGKVKLDEEGKEIEVYRTQVSVQVGKAGIGSRTLSGLPVNVKYTVTERQYDLDGYVPTDDPTNNSSQDSTITTSEPKGKLTFMNEGLKDQTPNQGIVNRYTMSEGILNFEPLKDFFEVINPQ